MLVLAFPGELNLSAGLQEPKDNQLTSHAGPSRPTPNTPTQQDAHNLAWKLAAVLRGSAHPQLLHTYEVGGCGAVGGTCGAQRNRLGLLGGAGCHLGAARWGPAVGQPRITYMRFRRYSELVQATSFTIQRCNTAVGTSQAAAHTHHSQRHQPSTNQPSVSALLPRPPVRAAPSGGGQHAPQCGQLARGGARTGGAGAGSAGGQRSQRPAGGAGWVRMSGPGAGGVGALQACGAPLRVGKLQVAWSTACGGGELLPVLSRGAVGLPVCQPCVFLSPTVPLTQYLN